LKRAEKLVNWNREEQNIIQSEAFEFPRIQLIGMLQNSFLNVNAIVQPFPIKP